MKQKLQFSVLFLFFIFLSNAQSITVSNAGSSVTNGVYTQNGTFNGKPKYSKTNGSDVFEIRWNNQGSLYYWVIMKVAPSGSNYYYSLNNVATPDLVTVWQFEGSGLAPLPQVTQGSLSAEDFSNVQVSIFPNPTSNSIQIIGLNSTESYTIHDVMGRTLLNGILPSNNTINLENFTNGNYYLKLSNGLTYTILKK